MIILIYQQLSHPVLVGSNHLKSSYSSIHYQRLYSSHFNSTISSLIFELCHVGVCTLDTVDRDIILELFKNCRISYEDLGQKTGLTSSSVWRRVSLLLESGVIERFVTQLSAEVVKSDPVITFVSTNGEENENELVEAIFKHPMVVSISPVINRFCLVISEIVEEDDLESQRKHITSIDGVSSVEMHIADTDPSWDLKFGIMDKFTQAQMKVLRCLTKEARMSLTDLASCTGFTHKKVNMLMGEIIESGGIWFTLRGNLNAGDDLSILLKIRFDGKELTVDELRSWLSQEFPDAYWWTYISLSEQVIFTTFVFKHINEIAHISKKVQEHIGVISTEPFFDLPARKRPRLRTRRLEEMLTKAGF